MAGADGPFGEVFGFPFVLEGFAFFMEAIFVGINLFGWNRLSPRAHIRATGEAHDPHTASGAFTIP